jgi:hypothetical protein
LHPESTFAILPVTLPALRSCKSTSRTVGRSSSRQSQSPPYFPSTSFTRLTLKPTSQYHVKENWESDAPQGWLARDHDDWCTSHQMIKGLAKVRPTHRLSFRRPSITWKLHANTLPSERTRMSYLAIARRLSGSTRWRRSRTLEENASKARMQRIP